MAHKIYETKRPGFACVFELLLLINQLSFDSLPIVSSTSLQHPPSTSAQMQTLSQRSVWYPVSRPPSTPGLPSPHLHPLQRINLADGTLRPALSALREYSSEMELSYSCSLPTTAPENYSL